MILPNFEWDGYVRYMKGLEEMSNNDHIERTKRMIEVMQAYVDGERVECRWRVNEKWVPPHDGFPKWRWESTEYRIAKIPDTINWDHVAPEFKYMARDRCGHSYIYINKPKAGGCSWSETWDVSGECLMAKNFSSYRKGTVDWEKSLVIRPGCE